MNKIQKFQITGMTIEGFKSYKDRTTLEFGPMTFVTGGNGRGKTSIADAIAFAITGLPFFGKRGIDRLYNEVNPDVCISLRFLDEAQAEHTLTRTRYKDRMNIIYDGVEIRQVDLTDLFGDRDVFLSIFNPLYFIEELGDSGKNLLERHLPTVSHEAVLAELSESVRAGLDGIDMSAPEARLKKLREEIRTLEKDAVYLEGQKDLAFMQARERKQNLQDLETRYASLSGELAALEEKRFANLDTEEMDERLAELSRQYDELASDDRSAVNEQREELRSLQEKIKLRKQEQYISKFTEEIANVTAQINTLVTQYRKETEAHKNLAPGMACPTCHRPVTEQNLEEVRATIKAVVDEIMEQGTQRRAELAELLGLEKKSRETFEQYRSDDLKKWSEEVAALEKELQKPKHQASAQAEQVRAEIQSLTADLEYGNLSQTEYDRMGECRKELEQCKAELAAQQKISEQSQIDFDAQIKEGQTRIEALTVQISNVQVYLSERAKLMVSQLEMNKVKFSLFELVKTTGELKDTFKFTYDGRSYDRLSLSEKIRAGMEVSELMKRLTGRNYPVFVDNMESVDDLANVQPTGQVIMAKCVHGADLSVQPAGKPAQRVQQSKIPDAA